MESWAPGRVRRWSPRWNHRAAHVAAVAFLCIKIKPSNRVASCSFKYRYKSKVHGGSGALGERDGGVGTPASRPPACSLGRPCVAVSRSAIRGPRATCSAGGGGAALDFGGPGRGTFHIQKVPPLFFCYMISVNKQEKCTRKIHCVIFFVLK